MWPFKNRANRLVKEISAPMQYTLDKHRLAHQQFMLLFVCDDMMRPHKNYDLIRNNSAKVSRGFTQHSFDFRVGRHTGRGLPFTAKTGLKIKGELHAVETEVIPHLDKVYKNGVEFARCRIPILVTDRDHQLVPIGSEQFLKSLPNGMIRTIPELGIRHYLSDPQVCIIRADMYIAIRSFWIESPSESMSNYPSAPISFPAEPKIWLPKYFKYPIDRNR